MESDLKNYSSAYDDVAFKNGLEVFLGQGAEDCSRSEGKQKQRFDLQYDQENKCAERLKYLEKVAGGLQGKKILEIGCGSGGLITAAALLGAQATGIEPDQKGFEVCELRKKRYPEIDLELKRCSAEELLFPDEEFDFVFMISVLEHVKNPERSLGEIHRVLKNGGICFIDMPNRLWPMEPHYRMFLVPFLPKWIYKFYLQMRGKNPDEIDNLNFFTAGKLARKLQKTGFKSPENLSKKEFMDKIKNPSTINKASVRKMNKAFLFVIKLLIYAGFYPTIRMKAVK